MCGDDWVICIFIIAATAADNASVATVGEWRQQWGIIGGDDDEAVNVRQ